MAMHYSIWEQIKNILWEAWAIQQNKLLEFLPDIFCRFSVYAILLWVFLSSSIMWNGNWICVEYQGWYFPIAMQRFLLWWEILYIIIHSYIWSIKTHVSWSTTLTAPTVCCWYGRSRSVGGGNVFMENWGTEFEQKIMTKIEIWEW